MTVYFMRRKIDGAIKIGYTGRDPEQRLLEIQNAGGLELELLVAIDGDRESEQAYHADFAEHRLFGEWFAPNEDLENLIRAQKWFLSAEGKASLRRFNTRSKIEKALREHYDIPEPDVFNGDTPNDQAYYLALEVLDQADLVIRR